MYPILFTIGRIEVSSWWAMLLGGFAIAGLLTYLDAVKLRKSADMPAAYYKDSPFPRQILIIFL